MEETGKDYGGSDPAWLARGHEEVIAHTRLPTRGSSEVSVLPSVSGRISAQSYEAHATRGHDELVVWWLVDDTDRRLAEEALATERERTRFLAEASNILLASLNSDRCMDATAQLAAEYLADVAIVVTPTSGRRLPIAHAVAGQDVTVLNPGETCLLYTDGFSEARGGPPGDELFGDERLKRALSQCAGMPAEAVVERVQMLASQWLRDGAHDDMAVVAITAPRTTHLSAVNGHTRGRYTA
ncbi:SpoIIE family protein phosphatase [Streptomyces sp. NPDC059999]|uniref:SpoIIE family protein phosphatase n=1 Tax=Streptomyces sp. NPDC059999 TaxID=3347030 RepID=UPI0036BCB3DB